MNEERAAARRLRRRLFNMLAESFPCPAAFYPCTPHRVQREGPERSAGAPFRACGEPQEPDPIHLALLSRLTYVAAIQRKS